MKKRGKKEEEAIAMDVGRKELVSFRQVCVRQLASMDAIMTNNRQGTLPPCIYRFDANLSLTLSVVECNISWLQLFFRLWH